MDMSKKAFFVAALALLFAFGFSVESNAQKPKRPLKQFGRWLGDGLGNGYHWRNKGPNVGYYNPYSVLNSQRISDGSLSSISVPAMDFAQPLIQSDVSPPPVVPNTANEPVIREEGILQRQDQRGDND
jgi:hypothetical protein